MIQNVFDKNRFKQVINNSKKLNFLSVQECKGPPWWYKPVIPAQRKQNDILVARSHFKNIGEVSKLYPINHWVTENNQNIDFKILQIGVKIRNTVNKNTATCQRSCVSILQDKDKNHTTKIIPTYIWYPIFT